MSNHQARASALPQVWKRYHGSHELLFRAHISIDGANGR
jgi:hypothetical protein